MVKIKNWNKASTIICFILCIIAFILFFAMAAFLLFWGLIFYGFEGWFEGSYLIFFALILFIFAIYTIICCFRCPETVILDDEKIVLYRFKQEINRISWQNVKEIYKKDNDGTNLYYFSDGQDKVLDDKNDNEHFVVFKCPQKKEHLFSKFTDLSIEELESNK